MKRGMVSPSMLQLLHQPEAVGGESTRVCEVYSSKSSATSHERGNDFIRQFVHWNHCFSQFLGSEPCVGVVERSCGKQLDVH